MGLREKFKGLKHPDKQQNQVNDSLNIKNGGNIDIAKEMVFKVFSSSPLPMAISNLESGIYVDVNDAFLEILGYKKDGIIGRTSDDIQVFADIEESNKYIRLLSKFKKVTDFPVNLKKKNGENKPFLFSSETIKMGNEVYLLTTYTEANKLKDNSLDSRKGLIINEIFETISSYLALFCISSDDKIIIKDFNHKAEEVEHILKSDIIGKCINDTELSKRLKLVELLNHLRVTGDPHKLSVSPDGDDYEGHYLGFLLSNGDFVITWEPGHSQKTKENEIFKQGTVFEKLSGAFPELIYEVDLTGKVTYANSHGLEYFGYSTDDIKKGLTIAEIFPPEELRRAFENLKKISSQGTTSENKYLAWKKDKTLIPVIARTFGVFHHGKLTGYRGVITDISEKKKFEEQIVREKAFLENLIDSSPEAI
jgi:PAS domain S-box-containing protein